jgi:hypothetical protein
MFYNFGDLGAAIKSYVDEYQVKTQSSMKIESVADMKRFVEEYPEFRRMSGNVSKHVALVSELSRRTEKLNLMRISELEQSLACNQSHSNDLKSLKDILSSTDVGLNHKLRLVMLYALRYEKTSGNATQELMQALVAQGCPDSRVALVDTLIKTCGADQRQDDLFENENVFMRGLNAFRGLKGVENVYTQHTPHMARTIDALLKGTLKDTSYPFMDGTSDKPQDIILFMVGGVTFAESAYVAQLNAQQPGIRVVLGGTSLPNSSMFLDDLQELGGVLASRRAR